MPLVSGGNAVGLSGTWTNTSKDVFSQEFFESFSAVASCKFESVNFADRTPVFNWQCIFSFK